MLKVVTVDISSGVVSDVFISKDFVGCADIIEVRVVDGRLDVGRVLA